MVEYNPGLDDVFGALADPTRRAILVKLESNSARVTDQSHPDLRVLRISAA
jgi:hypothetical protein